MEPSDVSVLCDYCTKALTIDDARAGGIERGTSKGTSTLDVGDFSVNRFVWQDRRDRCFYGRSISADRGQQFRHLLPPACILEQRDSKRERGIQYRNVFCSLQQEERLLSPLLLSEQLPPKDSGVNCPFCLRLKELLVEYYEDEDCYWWRDSNSTLRLQVRYEWRQWQKISKDGVGIDQATPWEERQHLDGLSVLVRHPEHSESDADMFRFNVAAWPGVCRDWLKISLNPVDPGGIFSSQNARFVRECLNCCDQRHPRCVANLSGTSFVPTRLLEIRNEEPARVWLVTRDYLQPLQALHPSQPPAGLGVRYAALSYCWGSSVPGKSTKGQVERAYMEEGIAIHNMPATIRDAIHVTRKLGLQYLWVDAFCILQDDKDDWEAESAQMCHVFASSYVTLCAARAASCLEGFLHPRTKAWLDLRFQSTINPAVAGHYSILLDGQREDPCERDIQDTQWHKRAWVWQEEIMSPRLLMIGQDLVQFRCDTACTLEYGLSEHREPMSLSSYGSDSGKFWEKAVTRYSPRQLTVAQDRLSAIAGVVKAMQGEPEKLGRTAEYIAGIWADGRLAHWLLWRCVEPASSPCSMRELFTDPATYVAPSWTWASRNTGVEFGRGRDAGVDVVFRCISYDVRPAYSDATIAVRFGSSLTLHGKLLPIPRAALDTIFRAKTDEYQLLVYSMAKRQNQSASYCWLDWKPEAAEKASMSRAELFVLTMVANGRRRTVEPKSRLKYTFKGLVLVPFQGPGARAYHRVGVFKMFRDRELWIASAFINTAFQCREHTLWL